MISKLDYFAIIHDSPVNSETILRISELKLPHLFYLHRIRLHPFDFLDLPTLGEAQNPSNARNNTGQRNEQTCRP